MKRCVKVLSFEELKVDLAVGADIGLSMVRFLKQRVDRQLVKLEDEHLVSQAERAIYATEDVDLILLA